MARYCYVSRVLPGKSDIIRSHWKNKCAHPDPDGGPFWRSLSMTGFECWLQTTPKGDFMIHCLEGESLDSIFTGLRQGIRSGVSFALKLNDYYKDVFGKDYTKEEVYPKIDLMSDIALEGHSQPSLIRKGYVFPLLPHKLAEHKKFKQEVMGSKKSRHEASMKAFGVVRLTTWLQQMPDSHCVVVYSERHANLNSPAERLAQGSNCPEWKEISAILQDHTGLSYNDLSPDIEQLSLR
jgi:hypothetical protein